MKKALSAYSLAAFLLAAALASTAPGRAAPPPVPEHPSAATSKAERDDYANDKFMRPLDAGLKAFYGRSFKPAQAYFESALNVIGDNTFAISFLNAAAVQQEGNIDVLTNVEEDAVSGAPKNYVNHVRLGFSYMFESLTGRDRTEDAREEFNAAVALNPDAQAAHVGLGILRFNERSTNRAKLELLSALKADPNNVLAREYLGQIYQTDLQDPQRGLSYVIDVPNLVPDYADIQFHIGSLLHDLHQPDEAIRYLKNGIAIDTGHVGEAGQHGYTTIARIEIEQHRLAEAQRYLNAAIAADVDTIYANTLLAKLKKGDYDASPSPGPARS